MCSLHGFPPFPPKGHISLCEVEGRVHSMQAEQADVLIFTSTVSILLFKYIYEYFTDLRMTSHSIVGGNCRICVLGSFKIVFSNVNFVYFVGNLVFCVSFPLPYDTPLFMQLTIRMPGVHFVKQNGIWCDMICLFSLSYTSFRE
jgi:hypothetical protein